MIFYYSGTGNTKWAARQMAELTGDDALFFIPDLLRDIDSGATDAAKIFAEQGDYQQIGIMFPIYSWGVPPIVSRFVSEVLKCARRDVYLWAVCTCGDEAGIAMRCLKQEIIKSTGREPDSIFSLIMPNDYVLLPGFNVDSEELAEQKLHAAPARLSQISSIINAHERGVYDVKEGSLPWLRTRFTFPLFRRWGVNTKRWKVSDACISCGKCERSCPAKNIKLTDGKPVWGDNCYSCCACFHVCPAKAISYSKITRNKGQYFCPLI